MPLPSRNTTLAAVSLLLPLPRTDSATKECWVVVRTGNAECGERQQMPHGWRRREAASTAKGCR